MNINKSEKKIIRIPKVLSQ